MDRLKAMQVFVEVVDRGSLSAAAQRLDMSRAMVSRYLAELEAWVGARLLHRTTRRLSLTPAGAETLPRCRRMLDLMGDMHEAVAAPDAEPRGQLRISVSLSFGAAQLGGAVADFVDRYPGASVDLQLVDRIVNLVEDGIDLAVRITNELDPNLIARKLAPCRSAVCAAPAYLKAHGTPARPEDLAKHNCLTHTHFGKSLWRFRRDAEWVDVPVSGSITANDALLLARTAVRGSGIAMLPTYLAGPEIAAGRLVPLLTGTPPEELGIYGVYASRRQMPLILRAMLDFLAERFGDAPWDART
ncbi:LysR family transcriptional regulator [Bordetella petrii]|uniref:LysR family transcriptional regulator n=1 Tax=Bordetella petrii TaxID=94624 RepID=A0ABT7W878_9BORD|nr:LysR family transcriptional regulator [Bordetella petrii]MDM9561403.1 LysR family transcriptional regulator [Bordetella petrii]